jgi:GntR family transcriptional regulator, histidine utilization repressor
MTSAARRKGDATSLHQRILTEVGERILSGSWPPGSRIPFEHELMKQYHCSRMTVSKVLTQLASAGLIQRRRKAGSFVARPQSQSAVLEIQDIRNEVLALGTAYRFEITHRRRRRSVRADRDRLDVSVPGSVLELTCRHFAGPRPFCFEDRLINLTAVPDAAEESFTDIGPGAWLVGRVPWTAAEHKIRATDADVATAAALDILEGSSCLVIERRTWRVEQAITYVRLTYPGNAHELVARFAPSQS